MHKRLISILSVTEKWQKIKPVNGTLHQLSIMSDIFNYEKELQKY